MTKKRTRSQIARMGGKARRDALSPRQRSISARKAVNARWAKHRARQGSLTPPTTTENA